MLCLRQVKCLYICIFSNTEMKFLYQSERNGTNLTLFAFINNYTKNKNILLTCFTATKCIF